MGWGIMAKTLCFLDEISPFSQSSSRNASDIGFLAVKRLDLS
jgi:hypothetical protein